ncbi:hypothetical protein OF820_06645 [Oceanotoga sp. DSM 15011]|uniref:hypothetical protein n=1 Tax=Oceanotoga sp. DSM 15011 TaxID=2984951 RepID=UPI0021F45E3D|nr:hypothetical protein [Oceanotoga sp. DSM 15011]UYP01362.1 hypothetical protein OF820_06645 [Oceanotoga sp. DSM 15011]
MNNSTIEFDIKTENYFHIGSGFGEKGICDETILKDCEGYPDFKSETFKGLFKQSCRELKYFDSDIGDLKKSDIKEIYNILFPEDKNKKRKWIFI